MKGEFDLVKGSLTPLLLILIAEKPMYGYQIIKELERKSRGYFRFKEGSLYPALHRLEASGLISGRWQSLPRGRQRRYYHITDKGRAALVRERSRWRDFLSAINLVVQPEASEA